MLASTSSSASRSNSSFGPYSRDRGRAISPVRVDSRIPNGAMSFMKESILDGLADLCARDQQSVQPVIGSDCDLHFHDAIVCADIQHLSTELMCQMRNSFEMFVFMPQSLTGRQS